MLSHMHIVQTFALIYLPNICCFCIQFLDIILLCQGDMRSSICFHLIPLQNSKCYCSTEKNISNYKFDITFRSCRCISSAFFLPKMILGIIYDLIVFQECPKLFFTYDDVMFCNLNLVSYRYSRFTRFC